MKSPVIASVAIVAAVLGWLQASTPRLVDGDSGFHARCAELLPRRGLSRSFEWTQESVWKDRYADKEFLFHVWLAPFCRGAHVVGGAKVASWLLGVAVVGAFAWILVRQGIPRPWLWTLLFAGLGNHFLFRLLEVRPHTLSLLLTLLGLHFLLRQRWRAIAITGFVFSWSYAAPHLLVGFAIVDAVVTGVVDRRWEWRGMAAAAGGVLAGLVIHPYFPADLQQWWLINVRILGQAWMPSVDLPRLGAEFDPVTTRSMLLTATLPVVLLGLGLLGPALTGAALGRRSKSLAGFAIAAFLLYCMSAKFVEYFAPIALLAAASIAGDLWPGKVPARLAPVALLLGLLLTVRSVADTRQAVTALPPPDLKGAAEWTRDHVPAGETVVHLDWGDFVQLFLYDPSHRYLVGLDPMLMYEVSPAKVALLEGVRRGRRPFDAAELSRTFGSKWLVLRTRLRHLPAAAGLRPSYEDGGGAVYRLAD